MKEFDARGQSCPEPVLVTRRALAESPQGAVILADNPCSVENITRYARHAGFEVALEDRGDHTRLTLTRV